jgi:hypothetical protein
MDIKEKIEEALRRSFRPDVLRLEDDGGISGFVVSSEFRGMAAIDRQTLLHRVLRDPPVKLSRAELRRVLGIAALTPAEYDSMCLSR